MAPSWESAGELAGTAAGTLGKILLTWPSDATPLGAILITPFAAVAYMALRNVRGIARFKFRRMLRTLLSRRYFANRSHRLDIILMLGNIGVFGMICGHAIISLTAVSGLMLGGLDQVFGAQAATTMSPAACAAVWTLALFLSYEFAYWIDHYLSHNIPVLWEFHKVHHTAEVLSPLTNFRVHPIDSLVFVNIIVLCNGVVAGSLHHLFGAGPVRLEIFSHTTLIALAVSVFSQLQHTHIWIAFTGFWGRLVLSPAHHQIHHSADVRHHNKNLGNLIGVFDWLFGTLHVPSKEREKLVFGLGAGETHSHEAVDALVQPFLDSARHMLPPRQPERVAAREAGVA